MALAMALLAGRALAQETAPATQPDDRPTVIVVIGAEGAPEYGPQFAREADLWAQAARRGKAEFVLIGRDATTLPATAPATAPATEPAATEPAGSDKAHLHAAISAAAADRTRPLYLVMLGHGTFDGRDAKLNLAGPDVSDSELAAWLAPVVRPLAVIDCTAASAPFLTRLSGRNRVIITATRSGSEINYARFGEYFAEAINDPAADLDKDGETSLLEAFLQASHRTAEFYKQAGRLMTEHALLDDNGDKLGISADFFSGTRANAAARGNAALDGPRAHQWALIKSPQEAAISPALRARRDEIELQMDALRQKKPLMADTDYYGQLEPLLLQLAHIYQEAGQ